MAKVQNTFLKSKMNKDLDARILPNGEYRDAQNAQISKSETSTVGNLENVLGNNSILNITQKTGVSGLICIGNFVDEVNNTVYLFLTNNLSSENYIPTAENFIVSYNVLNNECYVLVKGAFLNFYEKNLITGINILETLLFFTDNRNQPRVIDVSLANTNPNNTNPTYYTTEDQISVAKYNPYQVIELYQKSLLGGVDTYETTMKDVSSLFMPNGGSAQSVGSQTNVGSSGNEIIVDNVKGQINDIASDYDAARVCKQNIFPIGSGELVDTGFTVASFVDDAGTFKVELTGGTIDLDNNQLLVFEPNPYYDNTFSGDPDYLEDKFVRFSYRYKFVDNTYSIFAPFTQIAFIPKQDGYFLKVDKPNEEKNDQLEAYQSTVVYFVENKANSINLKIPLPYTNYTLRDALKVSEIDILYKESDSTLVKVIESVPIERITESAGVATINQPNSGQIQSPQPININNIQGSIISGSLVEGIGIPQNTTVLEFTPTNPSSPISGTITLNNDIPAPGLVENSLVTFGDINYFDYEYNSIKPIKVLPESDLVRVFDKVPLKALAQEVSGNRVIYGNFVNRLDPPNFLDYNVICTDKSDFNLNNITQGIITTTGTNNKIPAGDPIACTFSQLLTPPNGLYPGMVISSPTFGTSIPPNTVVTSVSDNGQAFTTSGIVSESSSANVIKLSSVGEGQIIGAVVSGVAGIPANTIVTNFNPTAIINGVLTPTVTLNQSVSVSANDEITFTVSGPVSSSDITLSNPVIFPIGTVVLVFEPGGDVLNTTSIIEYPNSSVKTNRNYQVGFVLSDKFGRQSSVILSNNKKSINSFGLDVSGSTLYSPYISDDVVQESWPGNSLKVLMNSTIDLNIYNGDTNSLSYNPLGWYSYKIVVKQTEQEYYNVYLPGIMDSYPNNTNLEKGGTAHVVLINDNINKIPRDLNEVGPEQRQFGSSIQLYGRVENTANALTGSGDGNKQYYLGRNSDTVSIISTIQDLFKFNPVSPEPPNFFPQFYDLDSNPLVARITTESPIGQIASTEYFTRSGKALVANNIRTFTPSAINPAPPSADPQNYVEISGYSGDITSVAATGLTANMLVSAVNIPDKVYIASGGISIIPGLSGSSNIIKVELVNKENDNFFFVPVVDSLVTFTETIGGAPGAGTELREAIPGIQRLAVYETEPTESALDIYWETSSSGLISDLNSAVINNQENPGANDLFPFDTTPFNEGLQAKGDILTNPFNIVNNFGGLVTLDTNNGDSLVLSTIKNGYGQIVGGAAAAAGIVNGVIGRYFIITDSAGVQGGQVGPWKIRTTDSTDNQFTDFTDNFFDNIYYMYDNQEARRQFTFTFDISIGGVSTQIIKQVNLGNVSPLYSEIKIFDPDGGGVVADYGPDSTSGTAVPVPPNVIPVSFRRGNANVNTISTLKIRNGAANQTTPLSNRSLKFVCSSGNCDSDYEIFDQRIGSIGGPPAVVPGSPSNTPIFRLTAISQPAGSSSIAGRLSFTTQARSGNIASSLYYVTIRAEDASSREDVILEIDLRVRLSGGKNGNIFNKAIKMDRPAIFDFIGLDVPSNQGSSCGVSSRYQKRGRSTSDGCTVLSIDDNVQAISQQEKGIYTYAGGFFNDEPGFGWGSGVEHKARALPKKLRQTENIIVPFNTPGEDGYVVQRQTLFNTGSFNNPQIFPLAKASALLSLPIENLNPFFTDDEWKITIDPSSLIFNDTCFKRDSNNNTLVNEGNFDPRCMRLFTNWGSAGDNNAGIDPNRSRYNIVKSYNNITGEMIVRGSIAGMSGSNPVAYGGAGLRMYFYCGPAIDRNPWAFREFPSSSQNDINYAVKNALVQWMFSEWVWDILGAITASEIKSTRRPGGDSSDAWMPLGETSCPSYHGQTNNLVGSTIPCYPDVNLVSQTNFTWQ